MMIKDEETNGTKQSCLYRSSLLSEYVNLNLLAFQYLRNRNYKVAMTTFEKCIEISKSLDEVKHSESLTNFGVCNYFCGKFLESYVSLDKAKEITSNLIENYLNDQSIQYLHLRVLCNLSLTSLSLNKISECKSLIKDSLDLIKSQFKIEQKIKMLKELVYIFFRIDSLNNYTEQNYNSNYDDNQANENDISTMNGKTISKTLYSLHKTLRENNIDYWMKCLNDEAKKLRSLKDINGYVFVLINSFAANFYQSGKISEGVKSNFSKILKIYAEQYNKDLRLKEKNLNVIFTDFKNRIDTAMEIYKKLIDTENELNNILENVQENLSTERKNIQDVAISNKIIIKLFFKHALRQIERDENNDNNFDYTSNINTKEMKSQIELALKLLENNEFDCSKLNIFNINSEITKSLKILFENLIAIRNKSLLNHYFKNYLAKTFGVSSILTKRKIKTEAYMENKVQAVCKGASITKINFYSKGHSKYFYKVDTVMQALLIYKSEKAYEENKDRPYKGFQFNEIKSIVYGLSTSNLRKKFKNLNEKNLNNSYLFLSLMMSKRSIDFYFESEEMLVTWFYGLSYFIESNALPTKLPTISQFILRKTKLKLIQKLKDIAEKDELNPNKSLLILTQLNNYITTNEMGFHSLTFIQVMLLFRKITEKQGIIYK